MDMDIVVDIEVVVPIDKLIMQGRHKDYEYCKCYQGSSNVLE